MQIILRFNILKCEDRLLCSFISFYCLSSLGFSTDGWKKNKLKSKNLGSGKF